MAKTHESFGHSECNGVNSVKIQVTDFTVSAYAIVNIQLVNRHSTV